MQLSLSFSPIQLDFFIFFLALVIISERLFRILPHTPFEYATHGQVPKLYGYAKIESNKVISVI